MNRRSAIVTIGKWLGTVGLFWGIGCQPEQQQGKKQRVISLGSVEAVPEGLTVLPVKRVALVRDGSGIAAISMVCTHMNCALRHEGDTFVCPCHGAQFGLDGAVLRGPATENLRHVRVFETSDGDLAIDLAEAVAASTRYRPAEDRSR